MILKWLAQLEHMFPPQLTETFRELGQGIDNVANQAGLAPSSSQAPPNVRAIIVQANGGNHEIAIMDPDGQASQSLGIHYFLDSASEPSFANPTTIHLGPSRNAFINLGSQSVYWRAYSQYRNSPKSAYMVFGGSNPQAVNASGTPVVPRLPSQGSGGNGGRGGFGNP